MKQQKIVIVDYGIGNLFSVKRALEVSGAEDISIAYSAREIKLADKVILPGVGAFSDGMNGLQKRNLVEPVMEFAESGKMLLGICLGMQLLATESEEYGSCQGLNIIPGRVVPIPGEVSKGIHRKIPYIGWSRLIMPRDGIWVNSLLNGLDINDWLYMVHSFHVQPTSKADILAVYDYEGYTVTAAIRSGNIYGYQFHPEKSGPIGLRLIRNFLES